MFTRIFTSKLRLVLPLFVALLVVFAPAIEVAGHGFAPGAVAAKGGHGKGHGGKEKGHKNKGNRNHGENGKNHGKGNGDHGANGEDNGKGQKIGHHKAEEPAPAAVPLAQNAVTPTPTPLPSEPPLTTGTILVIASDCPAGIDTETVDWFATCTSVSPGVTFRLLLNGAPFDAATTGTTDEQGNLTFGDLDPGTYHLTEETGDWCHAESDSVDDNGDVIVRVNERSTVWIFHCAPAVAS
jgi:hypothetical protein